MEIEQVRLTNPDARTLVAEVQAEYTRRYGGPDATPLDAAMFDPPDGAFFVGYVDGLAVAMGGWRMRSDIGAFGRSRSAEVKRMYVVPHARRTGLARQVLAHLETTARAAGAGLMVLETGTEQPEAIALYLSAGYEPVTRFGHYAWSASSRYFGRPL